MSSWEDTVRSQTPHGQEHWLTTINSPCLPTAATQPKINNKRLRAEGTGSCQPSVLRSRKDQSDQKGGVLLYQRNAQLTTPNLPGDLSVHQSRHSNHLATPSTKIGVGGGGAAFKKIYKIKIPINKCIPFPFLILIYMIIKW